MPVYDRRGEAREPECRYSWRLHSRVRDTDISSVDVEGTVRTRLRGVHADHRRIP